MNCIICGRKLKRQAIPSMVIGPICLQRAFPKAVKRTPPSKAYRLDKKTRDIFDPLTEDFVARLEMMP